MTDLGASPGKMNVILESTTVVGEVIIQTVGAMDVGMLMLLAFLICREHLFWILSLSLAYRADTHVGGLASGRSCVFNRQNCLLAFWHVLNLSSDISTVLVSSSVLPKTCFVRHRVLRNFCEVYPNYILHIFPFVVHDPVLVH